MAHHLRRNPLRLATLCAMAVVAGNAAAAPPLAPAVGVRTPAPEGLYWPIGGVSIGDRLWLVDVYGEAIVELSDAGEIVARHTSLPAEAGGPPVELKFPAAVTRTATGLVVLDKDREFGAGTPAATRGAFLEITPETQARQPRPVERPTESGAAVFYVYEFEPLASGYLVFGDLRTTPPRSGFVVLTEAGPSRVLEEVPLDSTVRVLGTLDTLSLIATVGDTAYYFFPDAAGKARLMAVEPGSPPVELSGLPSEHRAVPSFSYRKEWQTREWGARQATAHLRQIENSAMPVGIYSWDGELYLLTKEARSETGTTRWWLMRLDRRDGSIRSRHELSTTAANLTVIPGEAWAFLEKSAVVELPRLSRWKYSPYMETTSILRIPAAALAESPGLDGGVDP